MLSENLVKLRKLHKLTQKQVAERLHISPQAYARYERNDERKNEPSAENLKILSETFNVTVDELIGNENSLAFEEPEVMMFQVEGLKHLSKEEIKQLEQNFIRQAEMLIEMKEKNK